MSQILHSIIDTSNDPYVRTLKQDHHLFIRGSDLLKEFPFNANQIAAFTKEWENLKLDSYMGDGGTYRHRRYGQFYKPARSALFNLLPHEPYAQSKMVNTLNGGVIRRFHPLTTTFVVSPVLQDILFFMSEIYDGVVGSESNWNIKLHPYRILASEEQVGKPAPEGLHRDGVDFIASLLIRRHKVNGGVTTITDKAGRLLTSMTLEKPFDIVMANDEQTMHDVTEITPVENETSAFRDVLVIAFTLAEKIQ